MATRNQIATRAINNAKKNKPAGPKRVIKTGPAGGAQGVPIKSGSPKKPKKGLKIGPSRTGGAI